MMDSVSIALPQLVLWYDSTRIQSWPALLAQVNPEEEMPSSTDFGRAHFTNRMTDDRHAAAEKITRNLPGLEQKGKKLILRGVGLLEKTDAGYRMSDCGRELSAAYREDPSGSSWIRVLARLLLTQEPRSRMFIGLMSEADARLYFTADEWWGGSAQRAAINFPNGRQIAPFAAKNDRIPNLRDALAEKEGMVGVRFVR